MTRAGMVAIVGLPNAGKSSLLNRLLGSKLSIVTAAAQTTRERVVGIDTRDDVQIVFMDTPGMVTPGYLLHEAMLDIIDRTIADADVVVLLLDGTRPPPDLSAEVRARLTKMTERLVVAINKSDVAPDEQLRQLRSWSVTVFGVEPAVISAQAGEGVDRLREEIGQQLPVSPYLYPEDEISTQSVRFFVSELVRETVFEMYQEEIPYSVAVQVEEFRETEDPLFIGATIYIERSSQKGILIGSGGRAIRDLGAAARRKIESFVDRRVYLDLWVKVLPKWRKSPKELRRFGFPVPDDNRHA
ncbi:MAG: GTPase Era [Gemmatimonadota bacterium]